MSAADELLVDALLADLAGAMSDSPARVMPAPAPVPADDRPAPPLRAMIAEQCAADPDRMPWPDDWFDHTDSGQVAACQSIWAAALITCIRLALGVDSKNGDKDVTSRRGLHDGWFGSRDFHIMCALAGFDGMAIYDRLSNLQLRDQIIDRFIGGRTQRTAPDRKQGRQAASHD